MAGSGRGGTVTAEALVGYANQTKAVCTAWAASSRSLRSRYRRASEGRPMRCNAANYCNKLR